MAINSFRDLTVWQKSMDLVETVYKLTEKLPKSEIYGLSSQIQRSAVSVPSNIAEGCQRNSRNEFKQFCGIAYGSSAELETQLSLLQRLYEIDITKELELLVEVQKMLNKLISSIKTNH